MSQQRGNVNNNQAPAAYNPAMSATAHSPIVSPQNGPNADSGSNMIERQVKSDSKFFFQPKYARLGVKGNFMPLATKPSHVDLADWLAHQSQFLKLACLFCWSD